MVSDIGYVVKCSKDDSHYQTMPGLIDIEDWNLHNTTPILPAQNTQTPITAW